MMLPVPLTVMKPSSTFHFGSSPFSFFHCERSFPSNSTIASDGGGPGSITFGSASFGLSAAKVQAADSVTAIAIPRQEAAARLPLPKGEGLGEGEQHVRTAAVSHLSSRFMEKMVNRDSGIGNR